MSLLPRRHGTLDLGKMHGADRGATAGGLDVLVENLARDAGFLKRARRYRIAAPSYLMRIVTSTRPRRPTIRPVDPNLRARADRESPYSPARRIRAKRVVARCRIRRSRAAALPHRTPNLSSRNRFAGRPSTATRSVRRAAAVVLAVAARSTTGRRSSCPMMVQRRDRRGPHRSGSFIQAARLGRRGDGGSCSSLSARLAQSCIRTS